MAARTVSTSPFAHLFRAHLRHVLGGTAALALGLSSGCTVRDTCQEDPGDGVLTVEDIVEEDRWICHGGMRHMLTEVRNSEPGDDGQVCAELFYEVATAVDRPCAPPSPRPPGAIDGRPLRVDGAAKVADVRRGDGWVVQGLPGLGDDLSEDERTWLASQWREAARYEHASVASFARFTIDLMRFGAPSDLLASAQKAGADEVRHAEAAFALAQRFDGVAEEPGALQLGGSLELSADLASFAAATFHEGCVGETLAAVRAAERRAAASSPAVQQALDALIAEEGEHAELAWRTVAWAIERGGASVIEAVQAAAREARRELAAAESGVTALPDGLRVSALRAYGVLDPAREARAMTAAWERVIAPALTSLLA